MKASNQLVFALLVHLILRVEGEIVLVARRNDILWLDLANQTRLPVVSADVPVTAFDVHVSWQQIFWATDYALFRTPLYDLHTTTLVAVTGQVGGLAVDWVHNHVYWSDITEGRIEAAHLDGRGRRVICERNLLTGVLTLDPQLGIVFWFEQLEDASNGVRIMSSKFDGSHIKILYEDERIHVNTPLVLDPFYKSLYFYKTNDSNSEQWEINYDGIEPHVKLFEREEMPPRSLSLSKHGFFYSNRDGLSSGTWRKKSYTLVYGNRTDTFVVLDPYFKTVDATLKDAKQLRVWSSSAQPRWPDDCAHHQCQHECVPVGLNTTVCICNFGYTLRLDNRTCSEEGFVLESTGTTFERIKLNTEQETTLYNDSSASVQAVDVHVRHSHIYWSDLANEAVYRAPIEVPTRKQMIVPHVSVYGVAVDWLHDHLYLSEYSSIIVSSLDGSTKLVLLKNLDAPAALAVDPINRFFFWVQCGSGSVFRAGLDGSNVTKVIDLVPCSTSLVLNPSLSTLYWLDWTGTLCSSDYYGSDITVLIREQARSTTMLDHNLLWTTLDEMPSLNITNNDMRARSLFKYSTKNGMPGDIKAVKSTQQPLAPNICEDFECSGLCLPSNSTEPLCLCPDGEYNSIPCSSINHTSASDINTDEGHREYLKIVNKTPFSVTLRCSGRLLTHPVLRPYIHVDEIDSLVSRQTVPKRSFVVRVDDKDLPFTIDTLNPATTYKISVRNRVTKASFSLVVHTAPPPLTLQRLAEVTVPGIKTPIPWHQQGVHYFSPNPWQELLLKQYILLLVSKKTYVQSTSPSLHSHVITLLEEKIKDNFVILRYYKTKEEFDDDPVMYLGNIPWGDEFWLAMVQITEYKETHNLDIVYSERFSLPDPYWKYLMEKILDEQD